MSLTSLEIISTALYYGRVAQFIDIASFSIVVFEWMITLDLEVSLVWNSRWSLAKIAFLLNRYLPIVDFALNFIFQYRFVTNSTSCREILYAMGCVYMAGLYIAEYTLALRTCVVWNMNRKIVTVLALFYVGAFTFAAYNYFHMIATLEFSPTTHLLGGCVVLPKGFRTLYVNYILLAVYDAGMLALMLYPTVREYVASQADVTPHFALMRNVYTEGTLFYAYLLLLSSVTIAVVVLVPDNVLLFVLTNRMIRAVFACRVLLHIRELSVQRQQGHSFDVNSSRGLSELIFN